jgi:hypothetical protein
MIYVRRKISRRGAELRGVGEARTVHDEFIICSLVQPGMAWRRQSSRRDADYGFLSQSCLQENGGIDSLQFGSPATDDAPSVSDIGVAGKKCSDSHFFACRGRCGPFYSDGAAVRDGRIPGRQPHCAIGGRLVAKSKVFVFVMLRHDAGAD